MFNSTKKIPIWFMRQAGRYLPEYLKIRKNFSNFIEFCLDEDAVTEVTLQPLKRFDLDFAIIFSDILIIPHSLGVKVDFLPNYGPKLEKIFQDYDIKKIIYDSNNKKDDLNKVYNSIIKTKNELKSKFKDKKLIGFVGGAWTLACYMINGSSSKDFLETRKAAYNNLNGDFTKLIEILIENISNHIIKQIEAGTDVIKIFDSWAGILPETQFKKWVIDPTKKIVKNVKNKYPEIPIIYFPKSAGIFLEKYYQEINCEFFALDNSLNMEYANQKIKGGISGNLDNVLLCSDNSDYLIKETEFIINSVEKRILEGKYIFNTCHGLLPETKIENVELVIKTIRNMENLFFSKV